MVVMGGLRGRYYILPRLAGWDSVAALRSGGLAGFSPCHLASRRRTITAAELGYSLYSVPEPSLVSQGGREP